ncbi:hypothetical protein EI94DRAFT_1209389 [Lactarius quietus]|nr:hypothetical protein EI94DRAFT_1209389 [Lactarius quietus]
MFSSNSRPLPQRTHSVNAVKHANYFSAVDEEMRDCTRVQRQGQEEDLREALGRMMARVEEMCATLKSSYQTNADLETQLKVAQSNLKLEQANTEMLEDALKSGSLSKDVGWRRSSREAGFSLQGLSSPSPPVSATMPASQGQPQRTSIEEGQTQQGSLESPNCDRDSRVDSPVPVAATPNDSRFFRFRFSGSGRSTPTQLCADSPPSTPRPLRSPHPAVGHLTSASLPSLVASSPTIASELEDLRGQLLVEKRKSEKVALEKKELECELESLSQALFEEVREQDGSGGAHQARRSRGRTQGCARRKGGTQGGAASHRGGPRARRILTCTACQRRHRFTSHALAHLLMPGDRLSTQARLSQPTLATTPDCAVTLAVSRGESPISSEPRRSASVAGTAVRPSATSRGRDSCPTYGVTYAFAAPAPRQTVDPASHHRAPRAAASVCSG